MASKLPGRGAWVRSDRAAASEMLAQSSGRAGEIVKQGAEQPSGIDAFVNIIPNNLFEVLGSNSAILSVMFFALFFGIGLLLTDTPNARALKSGFEGLFDVTMRLILIVIRLAPIGTVGGASARAFGASCARQASACARSTGSRSACWRC